MSIFPTKILLAIDGSEEATLAARTAADIADTTTSELHMVHAEPVPVSGEFPSGRFEISEAAEKEVRDRAQRFLDDQVRQIEAGGVTVAQAHLRMGRSDEEIVVLAEEIGAGLIVVGSRAHSRLKRTLIGSVSDSVVRHAHCPVLVVRGEENKEPIVSSKRILLATDGSKEAQLALSTAADLANSTNSQLHLVTVGPWNPDPAYAVHEVSLRWETYEEVSEAIGKEAQEILDNQVRKIEEAGGRVQEAHLRRGQKDQEIVRLSDEIGAGLIVMGSRGLGGMRRALIGSVSESVVRHAHCPVLVVRREE